MDQLKSVWKKLEGDYDLIDKIHVDPDKLDYSMSVLKTVKNEMSPVLKCVAERVFENDQMLGEQSFFANFTYSLFLSRVEDEITGAKKFPGVARLTFIWKELNQMEKRMLYQYFCELIEVASETDVVEAKVS